MTISQATGLGVTPESSFWLPLTGSHPLRVTTHIQAITISCLYYGTCLLTSFLFVSLTPPEFTLFTTGSMIPLKCASYQGTPLLKPCKWLPISLKSEPKSLPWPTGPSRSHSSQHALWPPLLWLTPVCLPDWPLLSSNMPGVPCLKACAAGVPSAHNRPFPMSAWLIFLPVWVTPHSPHYLPYSTCFPFAFTSIYCLLSIFSY